MGNATCSSESKEDFLSPVKRNNSSLALPSKIDSFLTRMNTKYNSNDKTRKMTKMSNSDRDLAKYQKLKYNITKLANKDRTIRLDQYFKTFFENKIRSSLNSANTNINLINNFNNNDSNTSFIHIIEHNDNTTISKERKKTISSLTHTHKNYKINNSPKRENSDVLFEQEKVEIGNRSTFVTRKDSSKCNNSLLFNCTCNTTVLKIDNSSSSFKEVFTTSLSKINYIRNSYYTKLVINNFLPTNSREYTSTLSSQPSLSTQTTQITQTTPTTQTSSHISSTMHYNKIFIFDWDDTLFCTSHLAPNGIISENLHISDKERKNLKEIEQLIIHILKFCIGKGITFIITNAKYGWIEYCCKKFYQELDVLLKDLIVISARSEFESIYPGQNKEWKIKSFLKLTECFNTKILTNILCFGDSNIEIDACKIFTSKFENAYVKTVKFREKPKPEELIKELKLVKNQIESIYSALKPLTLNVERKFKHKSK